MRNNLSWHSATVRAHRDLSASVREFEIRPERGVRPWTRGQPPAACACRSTAATRSRSYSLVGLPDAPGADEVYRIAVRRAEPGRGGSRWLWALRDRRRAADRRAEQPLRARRRRAAHAAGGRRHRHHADPGHGAAAGAPAARACACCYAARRADELIYLDALARAAGRAAAHPVQRGRRAPRPGRRDRRAAAAAASWCCAARCA